MGLLDAGYALFEFTGQKLLDIYDIISSAPAIVKIFQNNPAKKNRRKEKGLAGKFLTPKRGVTKTIKNKHSSKKDAHILVSPRTPKLSLALTPSMNKGARTVVASDPIPVPSTPSFSSLPTPTPTPAPEKIQKLESELTKLREEIAKLMSQPKTATTQPQQGGAFGTVSFPSQPVVPPSFVPSPSAVATSPPPPPPPVMAAPPPPPPPPPMMNSSDAPAPKLYRSASHVVEPSTPKKEMQRTMSLADVIKGASTANLRKTEMSRSPGGTPLDSPAKPQQGRMNDPQDFIAQALRKKFASINRYNTPETSQKRKQVDGDSGWDESPPASPERTRKYAPIAFVQDENVPPVENVVNA